MVSKSPGVRCAPYGMMMKTRVPCVPLGSGLGLATTATAENWEGSNCCVRCAPPPHPPSPPPGFLSPRGFSRLPLLFAGGTDGGRAGGADLPRRSCNAGGGAAVLSPFWGAGDADALRACRTKKARIATKRPRVLRGREVKDWERAPSYPAQHQGSQDIAAGIALLRLPRPMLADYGNYGVESARVKPKSAAHSRLLL